MSAHAYWEYIQFQGRPVTVFTTVTGAASSLAPQGDRRSVRGRVVCSVAGRVIGC